MTKSKWVVITLVASLVVNLLLVGVFIGQHSPPGFPPDPTLVFPRWAHTLPEPRQQALRPLLRDHRRNMRPSIQHLRQQHRALLQALQTDPLDVDKLNEALANLRAAHESMQAVSHAAFVAFVQQLTPAERAALLADIRAPRRGKPHNQWRPPQPPQ